MGVLDMFDASFFLSLSFGVLLQLPGWAVVEGKHEADVEVGVVLSGEIKEQVKML